MASLRDLKLRIRSIKSTQKIARAMEMVSAAKMKKAQQQALMGRPYLNKLREVMSSLIFSSEPRLTHPFLEQTNKSGRVAYIIITADRGLCGAFNTNVVKMSLEAFTKNEVKDRSVITVGRKIRQAMQRLGQPTVGDFEKMADSPKFLDTLGIAKLVKEEFLAGKVDEVYLVYNHFYSTSTQKPVLQKLLPIEPDASLVAGKKHKTEYIFEGDKLRLLDQLLRRLVNTNVYQAVLESAASEHSARMMAMHKASDSAKEIVGNLTLEYNKGRQARITTQLLEIVAGSAQ
jgi:F-type H+-transporting ATPase subunit gamma